MITRLYLCLGSPGRRALSDNPAPNSPLSLTTMAAFGTPRAITTLSIEVLAVFRVPHSLERIGDFFLQGLVVLGTNGGFGPRISDSSTNYPDT